MAGGVWMWFVTLCVFADILLLTPAQLDHMINIAVNKTCNLSSRYSENNILSGDCSAAINGNTDTNFEIKRTPNCIHTAADDYNPLWRVDLGRNISLHSIIIYGRSYRIDRMDCVQVSLDGEHVYTFPCPGTRNVTTLINLSPHRHGRVVTITRHNSSAGEHTPFLNICEVQIWVCKIGWWGSDCQAQCSQTCQHAGNDTGEDNYCDSVNGACVKDCVKGYWGKNCTRTCAAGCGSDTCSRTDGTCQCRPGWQPPLCQRCSPGHYNMSNDCQNTCGEGCHDTCSRTDGTCQCRPGWQPPLCQRCLDGYYSESNGCENTCGEGCHDTCSRTDGTCQCHPGWEPPLCQRCSVGHYNTSNDCQNTCGEGCHDTCSRTDGTCQCEPGWQPPLCQYCMDGRYNMSNDCQNTCGEGCNNTCNRTDMTCQCQTGWQPPLCQWCADGWFGSQCTECGHCANNSVCDNNTGVCPSCDGDFVAPLCLDEKMPHYGDKETVGLAGPVAGAAVGCSIVFLIIGILIGLWLRRSRSKQNTEHLSSPNETSMTCDTAERPGSTSVKDTSDYSNNVYDALDPRDENIAPYSSLHIQTSSKGT